MDIKVIGAGCAECDELYENVLKAMSQLGLSGKPEKVEDLMEIVKLGVMSSPSVLAEGKLIVSGQVPSVDKLVKLLEKQL